MTTKRLWQTIRLCSMCSSRDRVAYLRNNHIFGEIGNDVTIMDRRVPLYANLIRIHNNVRIASNVLFVTHDITHFMLNKKFEDRGGGYIEVIGCIEIMDNVFIGSNVTILNNVRIGSNSIVAAGAVVAQDVPPNSVVGGVPAKVICSFDEYLAKRGVSYLAEMQPKKQEVSAELTELMWEQFNDSRMY